MRDLSDEQKQAVRDYMAGCMDAVVAAFEGRPSAFKPASERSDQYERGAARGEAAYQATEEAETARILGVLNATQLASVRVLYFGCGDDTGHFPWISEGTSCCIRSGYDLEREVKKVWTFIDAALCYGNRGRYDDGPQDEGLATLRHKDGWTALSFWDRSVDHRGNSNSNFLAQGTYTFEQMCQIAEGRFPKVWRRYTFKVLLYETKDEG